MGKTFYKLIAIILLSSLMLISGCVSRAKYDNLQIKIDSLYVENVRLMAEVDELKNGEERLVNQIFYYTDNKDFVKAANLIRNLYERHPESPSIKMNKEYFDNIISNAEIQQNNIDKHIRDSIRLANIDKLGEWHIGNYVNDFDEPTGNKYVRQTITGYFSNTATAKSPLAVEVTFDSDGYVDITFDEYCNGTRDEDYMMAKYIKVVNKEAKKIYKTSSGVLYDEDGKEIELSDLLKIEGIYEFTLEFKYSTKYNFTINTEYLTNALIKAGIMKIEDLK